MTRELTERPGALATWGLRTPGGPAVVLQKLAAVARVSVSNQFAYIGELAIRSLFVLVFVFLMSQVWNAIAALYDVEAATGFTVDQLVWYVAFTEALVTSGPSVFDLPIDREVRSGDIVYRLGRPLSYPLFYFAQQIPERLLRFGFALPFMSAMALWVSGPIPLAPDAVAAALVCAVGFFVADWIWSFAISMLSFWVEDTFGIHLLWRRLVMLLSGLLVPLDAYPSWFGEVARALPFQWLLYRPARLFLQSDATGWLTTLLHQGLFAAVGLVLLCTLYWNGVRRLSAQGG